MISIYLKRIIKLNVATAFVLLCFYTVSSAFVFAQTDAGQSLSVTPTLFNMTAVRGQAWNSGIKVINNNTFPLTIYAQVVNFAPQGESGEGKFLPVFEAVTDGATLAEWIDIKTDAVTIAPEQTESIPFTLQVPEDASPGGHFAAILIGTKPPAQEGSLRVSTSQVVTSLFFVRLAGDVKEEASIREFHIVHPFVSSPKADFEVRFENKGNVHLQPQGEIVITNMWGKERGVIPINHQTHFGNVLPESIRKFEFSWKSEPSFSDIGRYKAELTLAYGEEGRKFLTSTDYFYVFPVKAGLITLTTLVVFILLVRWSIKAYVRRMLLLAGVEPEMSYQARKKSFVQEGDVRIGKQISIKAPVQSGVADFKTHIAQTQALFGKIKAILRFVWSYKMFFTATVVLCILLVAMAWFVKSALTTQRDYEVTINNADTSVTLSSEDILYEKAQSTQTQSSSTTELIEEQNFELILVNSSDTPGLAASLQSTLEKIGYSVSDLQSDFEKSKERTVIVYDAAVQEQAFDLSKKIGGALLSASPQTNTKTATITVYIGNDYKPE
jgi:hypothetical protein